MGVSRLILRPEDLSPTTLAELRNDLLRIWVLDGEYEAEIRLLNRIMGLPEDDSLIRDARGVPLVCSHNLRGYRKKVMEREGFHVPSGKP